MEIFGQNKRISHYAAILATDFPSRQSRNQKESHRELRGIRGKKKRI
jgi:hypothetical protein